MRSSVVTSMCVAAAVLAASLGGHAQTAQQNPPPPAPQLTEAQKNDPRVGLKPGMHDAGFVARNIELVGNLAKPASFVDPSGRGGLSYANSDLAFKGHSLYLGNFFGLNFYDVEDPRKPKLQISVECPGGQGDVSVHGNLLFMSVETPNGRVDCGKQGVATPVSPERFRGVRIFDITNQTQPKQIAAIQTCRGSHTHTLIVDPDDKANVYIYGSGTSGVRNEKELAGCVTGDEAGSNDARFSIDVIAVPLAAPATAKIVNRPRIFADPKTGALGGLHQGGNYGPGTQSSSMTASCHDITVYPEMGLAAGACQGNGILLDISDPVKPVRLDAVTDKNFAYWHSATFNNDGTKIVFTDEWGGGTQPRCRATDPPSWGANAIFDIVNHKLVFKSYYKMPAPQTDQENCVAHNGSIIPVPGRDIMVQAWYQGGLSVFDFTDSANPVEIAYFDRGPIAAERLTLGGYWSTYWYNGHVYGSEIERGLDIFALKPSNFLTKNEIDAAALVKVGEFNPQHQRRINYPPSFVVARAYVDQLVRREGMGPARATTLRAALDRADKAAAGPQKIAALDDLVKLSKELDKDVGTMKGREAALTQTLAATIRVTAAQLR